MNGQRRSASASPRRFSRRGFLKTSAGASGALLAAGIPSGVQRMLGVGRRGWEIDESRNPLRLAPEVSPTGLRLVAAPGTADIGGGKTIEGFLLNGSLPSPLLRVKKGEKFDVTMVNQLPDDLILHWHGLTPPSIADGHPMHQVRWSYDYRYEFLVENRAGTYWYHSHTHHRVAVHTQKGIGGMLLVEDDEEAALGLPSGDREIPIVLQDRTFGRDGLPTYRDYDLMEGHMGREPFGNGVHKPYLEVDAALYRFRLVNGSNARIFRLARSDGKDLVIIGADAGLLERPVTLPYADLAPGERLDLLMDFSDVDIGRSVMLRSLPFNVGGYLNELSKLNVHDVPLDLLEVRVARTVQEESWIPERLLPLPALNAADSTAARDFKLSFKRDVTGTMEMHTINGLSYEMERVDLHVPFDRTEIWTFTNDAWFAHPVHVHGTQFKVLSRTGGRGAVMPWETGLKDTVLVHPKETVRLAVRFSAHPGMYLIHCHNMEHEQTGMMLNFMVG
jgi:FtsP/CotA-like multicopper oxidase with cupredoxin domain